MVGVADEHRAQPVEGELAVGLGVDDLGAVGRWLELGVVGHAVADGPGRHPVQLGHQPLLDAGHQRAHQVALLEPGLEVAGLHQLGMQPALLEGLRVGAQLVVAAAGGQGLGHGLGGQHAGLDGGMAALDARGVQHAGVAADQRAAREHQLGQALQAAVVDGAGAVADALAAFDVGADGVVRLPALHLLERAHPGVLVVQPQHIAQRHLVVFQVVEEAAAEAAVFDRPAAGVHHQAWLGLVGRHFPQLLDADGEAGRVTPVIELVLGDQLLAQVAAGTLGKDGVLAQQLHAQLEVVGRLAVLAQAQVAGGHAAHPALVVIEHLGAGEAGEHLHAQRLGLLAQPLDHRAQADDVVALVVEAGGHQPVGDGGGAVGRQLQQLIAGDRLVQGGAQVAPVGDQFVDGDRVHHRARQDVRAGLAALLEHHHRDLAALGGRHLLQADGRGHAARPAADDHHVVFHGLARAELGQDLLRCHPDVPVWCGVDGGADPRASGNPTF